MIVEKLHTIWCQTSDMDRSVAFYRDALGLRLEVHSPFWSQFAIGENKLGLHPTLEGQAPPHGIYGKGWFLGLQVDDLGSLKRIVRQAGATIYGDFHDVPGGVVLDFADPDGNVIEAFQPGISAKDLA